MPCARYFLDSTGSLVALEEPGRCDRFWLLWGRRLSIQLAIVARPDKEHYDRLQESLADAIAAVSAHFEACPICRAWMDRADEAGAAGWMKVLQREHREEQYLKPFELRPQGVKELQNA